VFTFVSDSPSALLAARWTFAAVQDRFSRPVGISPESSALNQEKLVVLLQGGSGERAEIIGER